MTESAEWGEKGLLQRALAQKEAWHFSHPVRLLTVYPQLAQSSP